MRKNTLHRILIISAIALTSLLLLIGFLDFWLSRQAKLHLDIVVHTDLPTLRELRQLTDSSSNTQRLVMNTLLASTSEQRKEDVNRIKIGLQETDKLILQFSEELSPTVDLNTFLDSWQSYKISLKELLKLWDAEKTAEANSYCVEVVRPHFDTVKEQRNKIWDLNLETLDMHLKFTADTLRQDTELIIIAALLPVAMSILLLLFIFIIFIWFWKMLPEEGSSLPRQ